MRGRALLLYATCCLIWGSTWLAIKIGLADLPPFRFAGLRMGIACVLLTPLALRGVRALTRGELGAIAVSGFLQIFVAYALIFAAERTIGSGMAALLFASFPIWVSLLAHAFLPDEPLRTTTAIAAVIGMAGVAVLEVPAFESLFRGGGIALAALLPPASAVASAFANVWMKKRLSAVPVRVNLWGQTLVGSVFLFALSAAVESGVPARWTPLAIGALAYLSVFGTVIAFLALFWLIPRVPMASIGAIPLIDTLVAVALGAAILGEKVGPRLWIGGAMILAGAALANAHSRTAAAAEGP